MEESQAPVDDIFAEPAEPLEESEDHWYSPFSDPSLLRIDPLGAGQSPEPADEVGPPLSLPEGFRPSGGDQDPFGAADDGRSVAAGFVLPSPNAEEAGREPPSDDEVTDVEALLTLPAGFWAEGGGDLAGDDLRFDLGAPLEVGRLAGGPADHDMVPVDVPPIVLPPVFDQPTTSTVDQVRPLVAAPTAWPAAAGDGPGRWRPPPRRRVAALSAGAAAVAIATAMVVVAGGRGGGAPKQVETAMPAPTLFLSPPTTAPPSDTVPAPVVEPAVVPDTVPSIDPVGGGALKPPAGITPASSPPTGGPASPSAAARKPAPVPAPPAAPAPAPPAPAPAPAPAPTNVNPPPASASSIPTTRRDRTVPTETTVTTAAPRPTSTTSSLPGRGCLEGVPPRPVVCK